MPDPWAGAAAALQGKKQQLKSLELFAKKLQLDLSPLQTHSVKLLQVLFAEIGPKKTGIAVCTAEQALPFIQAAKILSDDPLALMVLGKVDVPATMTAFVVELHARVDEGTEPLIVKGTVINLGAIPVELATVTKSTIEAPGVMISAPRVCTSMSSFIVA